MGYFSEKSIQDMESSDLNPVDTFVCANCVKDESLADLVNNNLCHNQCSYCGTESDKPISTSFDLVIRRIYESLSAYYADAQDIGIPWDKGWVFPETELCEVVGEFDPGWDGAFIDDVHDSIGYNKYFVPHSEGDWGLGNPADTLQYGWDSFTEAVKHKTRYIFLTEPGDEHESGRPDHIPVRHMLTALGKVSEERNLISTIPQATSLYRVRASKRGKVYSDFADISVPPSSVAGAGRMNPAGIPYLYVALDKETARKETIFEDNRPYALGTLKTKQPLNILNLSELPPIPSVFEPDRYQERHELLFLHNFRDEISKPISKDGKEHIEYVPTQVLAEFFRHRFRYKGRRLMV